jgi:hypothetical protein
MPDTPSASSPLAKPRALRVAEAVLVGIAVVFWALHLVHLQADFPNYSFWKDWAKFTDEGWYGDAAIRHYLLGHWNLPGDFNPAAALPVWPAIELVLFRFTGVSLVAGRAATVVVFGASLLCVDRVMRRWADGSGALVAAATVALLAASPFCFVFTRIAILEPLLVLEMLAAMLLATRAAEPHRRPAHVWLWTAALGLLLPAMVLTKTTAVFLFPALFWLLWAATGYRIASFLRLAWPAAALGATAWLAYYYGFVRPRYLADYRYLFAANAYTAFTWKGLPKLLFDTTFDGIWIGKTLFALALLAIVGSIVKLIAYGPRSEPLHVTMLLWVLGYGAFLAYHANLQPRYYLVLAVPLTALVTMVFGPLFAAAARTFAATPPGPGEAPAGAADVFLLRAAAALAAIALGFAGLSAARQTLGFVLHPEYTWVNAAAQVKQAVDREIAAGRARSRMVLSISGSDLSLMTGLPSICDDFGVMTLSDRIGNYKPGFFATWNEVEDDKMEALAPRYTLQRVLAVPAFDDPDRNLLILYRLDPLAVQGPPPKPGKRRNMFVPKSLRSKIGEQPSEQQLTH